MAVHGFAHVGRLGGEHGLAFGDGLREGLLFPIAQHGGIESVVGGQAEVLEESQQAAIPGQRAIDHERVAELLEEGQVAGVFLAI